MVKIKTIIARFDSLLQRNFTFEGKGIMKEAIQLIHFLITKYFQIIFLPSELLVHGSHR